MKKLIAIIIKFLPLTTGFFGLIPPIFAFAVEQYTLLEPIPTPNSSFTTGDISGYLQTIFLFGISLAGILAVVMIVRGGIEYITAYGNPGQIENAKNRITQAILGLLLAVGAWLILYTINPDLAKGTLTIPPITTTTIQGGGGTFGGQGATGSY
ncbi:MAG: pilin [bacterium]|nr:pilin [bacterium]